MNGACTGTEGEATDLLTPGPNRGASASGISADQEELKSWKAEQRIGVGETTAYVPVKRELD